MGLLTLAAILRTQIEFPALYRQMMALERGPAAAVLVRNITLVTAALVAVDTLWRLPRSAPGRSLRKAHVGRQSGRRPGGRGTSPAAGGSDGRQGLTPAPPGFLARGPSRIMAAVSRPRGRRCGAARPTFSRDPGDMWTSVSTGAASSS